MTKPFEAWTVLPHGKLVQVDDNLFTVTGTIEMPFGQTERRMTIARLERGDLVVYSAIALAEAEMTQLDALGTPAYLIVPNDAHRLDVKPWKARYPNMRVIAPAHAREKVSEVVTVDDTTADFGDPRVQLVSVPGTDEREAGLVVESQGGTTLVLNDLIFNLADKPGLGGWLFKLFGFTGEPKMPGVIKMREVKDKNALAAQLESWAHLPSLRRLVVSHGNIIDHDVPQVLERVAHELAA